MYRFAATGTIGHNVRAAAEDRALLGSNPFGYAQGRPERRGSAIRHRVALFGVPPGHVSRLCRRLQGGTSQGVWGTGPQVFGHNILGAPTRNPEEPYFADGASPQPVAMQDVLGSPFAEDLDERPRCRAGPLGLERDTGYAETGANPRDTKTDTSTHRGLDMAAFRKILYEAAFTAL